MPHVAEETFGIQAGHWGQSMANPLGSHKNTKLHCTACLGHLDDLVAVREQVWRLEVPVDDGELAKVEVHLRV